MHIIQDIRAFNRDINSCAAMLYSKPKTDRKLLVELLMDCQVLTWVIRCFYADPVLAFTVSHAPQFCLCACDQPLPLLVCQCGWATYAEFAADDRSGYSRAGPVYSGPITHCIPGVVFVLCVQGRVLRCVVCWL